MEVRFPGSPVHTPAQAARAGSLNSLLAYLVFQGQAGVRRCSCHAGMLERHLETPASTLKLTSLQYRQPHATRCSSTFVWVIYAPLRRRNTVYVMAAQSALGARQSL